MLSENLKSLERFNPMLAAYLKQIESESYYFKKNDRNELVLCFHEGNKEIFLDHANDPFLAAKHVVDQNHHARSCFVVFGLGGGALFEGIRKAYPESLIIVIDPDAKGFQTILKNKNWVSYFEDHKNCFLIGLKKNQLLQNLMTFFLQEDHGLFSVNLHAVLNHQVIIYGKDYYESAAQVIKKSVGLYWDGAVGSHVQDVLLGLKQFLQNMSFSSRFESIDSHQNEFSGMTGIVVSSGPSLNNKLDWLRSVQDKALIVCADSSIKKLLNAGITPFAVSSLERDAELIDVYKSVEIPSSVSLFMAPQIFPEITAAYSGNLFPLWRDVFPFHHLTDFTRCYNLGLSCAHLSLISLMVLGCKRIALVGQDLAYDSQTGRSHFDGVISYAADALMKMDRIQIESNNGQTIESNEGWASFRDFFSWAASANPDVTMINVIEADRGAKIDGIERMNPDAFFKSLFEQSSCERSFSKNDNSNKVDELKKSLKHFLSVNRDQLPRLKNAWMTLKESKTIDDYFNKKNVLLNSVDKEVSYFFVNVFQSQLKRFESASLCLWDEKTFSESLPSLIEKGSNALDDSIEVLKEFSDL